MDLLVLIVAYKLSRINYFSLNSVETCRFEVTAFGFNFSVIKNRIRYFPLCQKKKVYLSLQWPSFILEEIDLLLIRLVMKSTDFGLGNF